MENWLQDLRDGRDDLAKVFVCIIPSGKMRYAFERYVLKELGYFHRVHFFTFEEWVLDVTGDMRLAANLRMIEHSELVAWVLEKLEAANDTILATHQKRLATAEAMVRDLQFLRLHDLDAGVVNEFARPLFIDLLDTYEDFLAEQQAVDYPFLLHYLLEGKQDLTANLVMYPDVVLFGLEERVSSFLQISSLQVVVEKESVVTSGVNVYGFENGVEHALEPVMNGRLAPDDLYLVYSNEALLQPIYDRLMTCHIPATFADGVRLEWTQVYYFMETMVRYVEEKQPVELLAQLVDARLLRLGEGKVSFVFRRLLSLGGVTSGQRFLAVVASELATDHERGFFVEYGEEVQSIYDDLVYLQELVERLLADEGNKLDLFGQLLERFFQQPYADLERLAYGAVKRSLGEMALVNDAGERGLSLLDMLGLLAGERLAASSEQPGHVHVSGLADVGPLYRKHYAWFGMAMEEFYEGGAPSAFISETVLAERGVQTELERLQELESRLDGLIRQGQASHTLYFTSWHMERGQKNNPILTYQPYVVGAEQVGFPLRDLVDELDPLVSVKAVEGAVVAPLYAHQGEEKDLLPFSPSAAKTLLTCSRQFMYERLMGLRDERAEELELTRWLRADLRGSLYHDILEDFVNESKVGPVDHGDLVDRVFARYESKYPPIYGSFAERERQYALEILEKVTSVMETDWQVLSAEETFGMEDEPIRIELDDGDEVIEIRIRGMIDRVDYHPEKDVYRIVDYKTGSPNDVDRLQIELYEKAYAAKYASEDIRFGGDSALEYVLKDERLLGDEAGRLNDFIRLVKNFATDWDEIDYEQVRKSGTCQYCAFEHLCAIREAKQ